MAYQSRTSFGGRSPIVDHEHRRSPWPSQDHAHHMNSSSMTPAAVNDIMDPESEESDAPEADGDFGGFSFPVGLPAAPSKQALDSKDALSAHLDELERLEDHNNKKHDRVKEKRARMDSKILMKRTAQDAKIKAIMDARARRDERIKQRRAREDIAFQRFREEFDEEETRLRRRLKNLKRGLPIDDAAPPSRRVSVNSMSPPGPSYSTVPPPAKRHQTSHPSQFEIRPPNRAPESNPHPPPPERAQYQFYPPHTHAPPPGSYYQGPTYHPQPHGQAPVVQSQARMGPPPPDVSPYGNNRPNGSPHVSAPTPPQPSTARSPTETPTVRHPTTSYDTRPPPPLPPPSSFAAVNHPTPQSAFAAVNSKSNGTPPSSHAAPVKEQRPKHQPKSAEQTPARASVDDEKTPAGSSSTNKRTPSTTHPYQMSEAFANRHHHCERTDSLNRGIWTWYGPGGTQDRPTAPATEMYLVCNHDGCRRIDWRTVHGLQCHIVKNHEIPKGTIGSLEKALAAYGVPVSEIEAIERRDGIGSGGTMADPKNLKIKSKLRESVGTPLSAQKQYRSNESDSPRSFSGPPKPNSSNQLPTQHESKAEVGPERTPSVLDRQSEYRPSGSFPAVNAAWQSVNATPSKRPASSGHDTRDGPVSESKFVSQSVRDPVANGTPNRFWSSWQATNPPLTTKEPPNSHQVKPVQPSVLPEANTAPASGAVGVDSNVIEPPKQAPLDEMKNSDERQEKNDSAAKTVVEKPNMATADSNAEDVQMTGTGEEEAQTLPLSTPSVAQPEQPPSVKFDGDETKTKDAAPVPEKTKMDKEEPKVTEQDTTSIMQSPEVNHRTRPSRRESRRTSIATAVSSKAGTEKAKEEEIEAASTTHTGSKAGSAVDDDGDSITVNVAALKAEKERKDEDDKTRASTRRLPNGRFMRRTTGR